MVSGMRSYSWVLISFCRSVASVRGITRSVSCRRGDDGGGAESAIRFWSGIRICPSRAPASSRELLAGGSATTSTSMTDTIGPR